MPKPKPPQPIPEPPLLVLAKLKSEKRHKPHWYAMLRPPETSFVVLCRPAQFPWFRPHELKVVKHDRNDAEAVKIIAEANKV